MTNLYDTIAGIPWFHPERYDVARATMADADRLPLTYDDWLAGAERRERRERASGKAPERVFVDDGAFVTWCREHKRPLDRKARSDFATGHEVGHTKTAVPDYEYPGFYPGPKRKK